MPLIILQSAKNRVFEGKNGQFLAQNMLVATKTALSSSAFRVDVVCRVSSILDF